MSERLDKVKLVKGRKWERMDPLDNIGVSTYNLIKDTIREGKNELAKDLIDYLYFGEIKFVRDANLDLLEGLRQFLMTSYGEDGYGEIALEGLMRSHGVTSWPVPPVKKRDISAIEFTMDWAARDVRSHRMGKNDGVDGFTFEEYEDRVVVIWDPCGGGRMRRGDPISGTSPRTGPPYNYAVTQVPHTWTWGKTGIWAYCVGCCTAHDLMEIEQTGGYLQQWITECPDNGNPWAPCRFIAYKDVDWIPEEYYTRIGKTKPKPTSKAPKFKDLTKPIKVIHSDELGPRWMNKVPRLKKVIDAGNKEEALQLVAQLNAEIWLNHLRFPLKLTYANIDMIVERYGYNELYHALRSIYSTYTPPLAPDEPKPTKASIPSAEERARKAALWGRGDQSGPNAEGSVRVIDEPDRIVMELDPCGSIGRSLMKIRLDNTAKNIVEELKIKELQTGSITEPPWNFKVTTVANPVAWGKVGIPHLCTRCCVHFEMASIARTGYLTTVVERPENATDPNCRWFFYKNLDDIPEKYYTRIGARKPV
ncbi:MAG: hypothetical protein ACFFH0_10285 [Promethearchaeota archaeon]